MICYTIRWTLDGKPLQILKSPLTDAHSCQLHQMKNDVQKKKRTKAPINEIEAFVSRATFHILNGVRFVAERESRDLKTYNRPRFSGHCMAGSEEGGGDREGANFSGF